jgi:hypothetical protein
MVAVTVAGLATISVGLLLVVMGMCFAWREFKERRTLNGDAADFVKSLSELVKALSGQPRSLLCFTFGSLLIFLGGVIAGVSGLTSAI